MSDAVNATAPGRDERATACPRDRTGQRGHHGNHKKIGLHRQPHVARQRGAQPAPDAPQDEPQRDGRQRQPGRAARPREKCACKRHVPGEKREHAQTEDVGATLGYQQQVAEQAEREAKQDQATVVQVQGATEDGDRQERERGHWLGQPFAGLRFAPLGVQQPRDRGRAHHDRQARRLHSQSSRAAHRDRSNRNASRRLAGPENLALLPCGCTAGASHPPRPVAAASSTTATGSAALSARRPAGRCCCRP